MNTAIPQEQRSPEWLAWRNERIGSSDAPIIMGISQYKTALELYQEKKGLSPSPFVSGAMKRGAELEPIAMDWYVKHTGLQMFPMVQVHPEYHYLHASMDGVDFTGAYGLEIKCPLEKKQNEIDKNGIPEDYYCQIQHQIFVCGLEKVDLLIFDGMDGKIYPVVRDEAYILKLLDKEIAFYKCLETNTPPDYAKKKGKVDYEPTQSAAWNDIVEPLRKCRERIKLDEELEKSLIDRAKELCGGRNLQGCGMSVAFIRQKGNVDYSKIPELKGVDLDAYRKEDIIKTKIDFD